MKLKNIIGSTAAKWAACLLATVSIGSAWAEEINVIDVPELTVTTLDPADDSLDWRGQLTPVNVALHYELSADVLAAHQEELAAIANWKIDWVLTSSEDLTLVNPRTDLPSGMTLEQVDASSEGGCISGKMSEDVEWVYAPFSGVFQLSANTEYRVYNQIVLGGGSGETGLEASSFVQNKGFGCALYLTSAYRMAHPNVVITLQPYLYHPSDSSVRYSLGEAKRFTFGLPDAPKAVVTKNAAYNKEVNLVNVNDILSGGYQYGTVTPNVAYTFEAKDTPEEASSGAYSNWKCDYIVSMDADTDAYSIGLFGQYGWGAVAFPSPVDAKAGQKIPLLMSVTKNGWNYSDIVSMVRSFTCGAINFSEENIGKTITVSLVMWNEDNPVYKSYENPYVVEEIKYKFETVTPLFASVSQGAPAVPVVYRKNTADEYGFSVDEDGYPVVDENKALVIKSFNVGEPHFAMVADNAIAKTSDSSYSTADEAVATVVDNKEITVNISTSIGSEAAPAGSTVTTTTGTAVTAGTDSAAETTVTPKTVTITSGTGSEQTVKTVEAYVVSQGSGEDKKFSVVTDVSKDETIVSAGKTVVSDFVKPAEIIAKVVASENLEADKVSSMVLSLVKTEAESSEPGLDTALVTAIGAADKAFEVHPVATITTTTEEGTTATTSYAVANSELAEDASFTFTLDFGVENAGKLVTLTHYASDGVIKQHNGKDSWTESLDANGLATVTLSEFSYLLGTVLNAFSYNDFVEALYANNGSFDGSAAAYADLPKDENGRLIVRVEPVGGSWSEENCTATWSTPYRLNDDGIAQLRLFFSSRDAFKGKDTTGITDVGVTNVAFVMNAPASGSVTGQGTFDLSGAKAYQLYLMNDGNVTFDNCEFDGVGLAVFPSEEKGNVYTKTDNATIIKDCSFANIYDYAIKEVNTPNYYVTGTTFENCGCAILVHPLNKGTAGTAAFVGNTFKNIDAGSPWSDKDAGGAGTVKFDIRNSGTELIWGNNTVEKCSGVADTEYHFRNVSNNVVKELKTAADDTHTISYVSSGVEFDAVTPGTIEVAENGTVTWAAPKSYVAQIGDVKYETFAEAIAAAEAMSPVPTITVLDATAEQTNDGWMFTQDGKTLFRKVAMVVFSTDNYATATTNYYPSAAEAFAAADEFVYTAASSIRFLNTDVTLLADDTLPGDATTVIEGKKQGGYYDYRSIDLNGHTLVAPKGVAIEQVSANVEMKILDSSESKTGSIVNPSTDADAFALRVNSKAPMTMESGSIVAKGAGTALKTIGTGSAILKGGSVTADPAGRALNAAGTNSITAEADPSVSVTGTLGAPTGVLTLRGGTFTANAANGELFDVGETGSVAVSGGSFSSAVPAQCIATGYKDAGQTAVVENYYTVTKEVYTITFLDENDTEIVTLQVPYNDYYKDHTGDRKIPAIPVKASDDPAFYYTGAWSPAVTTSTRATGNATHKATYTLGKYNFQYGDGLYTNNFANAYKNVADGGTITVCTEAFALTSTTLGNGKSVTVDLNGSTLSMNNTGMLTVSGEGTKVTFVNGTVKYGSGTQPRDALVKVTSPAEVAFEGVTLQGASYYTTAVSVASGASAAFSGECAVTMPSGKQAVTAADGGTVAISGGIYSSEVPVAYCAADYKPAANTDPATKDAYPYTVVSDYEAQIVREGVVQQKGTLSAMISAAQADDTVQLLKDVNATSTVVINKVLTLDGDYTITSSAAAVIDVVGTGDVTIKCNVMATNGHGINVGDSAHYSGKLTVDGSTVTVAKRGINVFDVDSGFELNVMDSTIQSNVADPTTTYTTGEDSRGINFSSDPLEYSVAITDSTIQGFSYDINVYSGSQNISLTMTGGATYGRAALNIWGSNNSFTMNGVTINGLNNQTGPTEAFACIVENVGAANNTYNINGCTFNADVSTTAASASGSNASEQMFDLRGVDSTVNITGNTTYTPTVGGAAMTDADADRFGFIGNQDSVETNTVTLDATALANLSATISGDIDQTTHVDPVTGDVTLALKVYVAQNTTTGTKYESLQEALDAANDGDTIKLLDDLDVTGAMYSGDTRFNLWINKSIKLDGDDHTLTVKGRGIGVQGASSNIDVTMKNLTVENVGNANGRCVDTRGKLNSLTLDGVSLTTDTSSYTGYLQPLTIGGNQSTPTTVTITDSFIETVAEANKGYAITTFNPVNMTITDSYIAGWSCLNIKGADSSAGSAGSTITVTDSTLLSANGTPGKSNAYSLVKIEDDNVNVSITGTEIWVNGGDNTQSIVSFQKPNLTSAANSKVSMGEDNNVTLEGNYNFEASVGETSGLEISGGIFNVAVPEEACATGYIPQSWTDTDPDTGDPITVYGVKQGTYVAQIVRNDEIVAKYESLAEAVAAAQADDTVTLIADVDLGTTGLVIAEGKNFTLDIGEYDITGTVNGKLITNNGTVVVNGTTGCIYNQDVSAQGHDAFLNNGTATINGGWFGDSDNDKTNANAINRGAGFRNFGTATINGGHFTACDNYTNGGYAYAIINGNDSNNPTLTINNADVYGKNNGNIANNSGSVTVKDGTFDVSGSQSYYSVYSYSGDTVVEGGTFTKSGNSNSQFCVEVDNDNASNPGSIAVSGGNFTKAVPEEFCADGYIPAEQDSETGMYTVKTGSYVAQNTTTGVKYETLQAAIDEATAGDTVTLLKDIDLGSGYVAIDKALTLDGDFTVTSSAAQAVLLTGSGDVTIMCDITASKGHGVQAGSDEAAYSGKLTVDGATITVAKRGIRVYEEDTGFGIVVKDAVIQSNVADPKTTYTTGNDAMALSLGAAEGKGYSVVITDSVLQGFSYCINSVPSGCDLTVEMNGGATYGRAALNVWGSNNAFTLDGVEVHGLNNQTGPTEGFACIVENTGAKNNTYNINGCTFVSTLSSAAASASGSSATEQMIDLRGTQATVKITGETTYTAKIGGETVATTDEAYGRFGLIYSANSVSVPSGNSIDLDSSASASLADVLTVLPKDVDKDVSKVFTDGTSLGYVPEVHYYWATASGFEGGYYDFNDPFDKGWLANGEFIDLNKATEMDKDVSTTVSFTLNLKGYTLTAGSYKIRLGANSVVTSDTEGLESVFAVPDATYFIATESETTGEQGAEVTVYTYRVMRVLSIVDAANGAAVLSTDLPSGYSLERSVDGGDWSAVQSTEIASGDLPGSGATKTYKFKAVKGASEIAIANTVGILHVADSQTNKTTIIGVPWFALGEKITVDSLVYLGNRDEGDKISAYDASADRYRTWRLSGGKWTPVTNVSTTTGGDPEDAGDADKFELVRGQGLFLERVNPETKPIYLVGRVAEAGDSTVPTTLPAGSSTTPTWTLVAAPSTSDLDLNAANPVDNPGSDTIVVTTTGAGINVPYTYDENGKWGCPKSVQKTVQKTSGNITYWVTERNTDNVKIPAGTGFWYLNTGAAKSAQWK